VLADKKLPNWVLKAAFEVKHSGFLPTGEYFEKLDDVELLEIKNSLEYINTENYQQFEVMSEQAEVDLQNLTLLCFILALGEGDVEINAKSLSGMLQYLFLLVSIESSHREGKVDVHRENYSLYGGNKPVVRNK
jgi:DUF4097 and DUF4098 domain-containing protein YvlB